MAFYWRKTDNKRWKYALVEDYWVDFYGSLPPCKTEWVEITKWFTIEIKRGYHWDGATCAPDYPATMRASCVHDALYQLIRLGLLPKSHRKQADKVFRSILRQDGMNKILSSIYYAGVRVGEWMAARPRKDNR